MQRFLLKQTLNINSKSDCCKINDTVQWTVYCCYILVKDAAFSDSKVSLENFLINFNNKLNYYQIETVW